MCYWVKLFRVWGDIEARESFGEVSREYRVGGEGVKQAGDLGGSDY